MERAVNVVKLGASDAGFVIVACGVAWLQAWVFSSVSDPISAADPAGIVTVMLVGVTVPALVRSVNASSATFAEPGASVVAASPAVASAIVIVPPPALGVYGPGSLLATEK